MRVVIAIGISVLVHLVLAAGLWWYFTSAPSPVVLAQLDLSSVELSLADEDVATAAPVASLPSSASAVRPPPEAPRPPEPQPETVDAAVPAVAEPRPPEPAAPELPSVPSVAPKQAKIDAPPKPRRTIRPDYPRGARLRKEEGDVVLEIHVDEAGDVGEVRIVSGSGFSELDEAAVRAAKAARFTPAKAGRRDVASVARLKLSFKLK